MGEQEETQMRGQIVECKLKKERGCFPSFSCWNSV